MLEFNIARELALEAGKRIMELYNDTTTDIQEWKKLDDTYATQADIEANDIIIKGLRERFPHHAILSEESIDDKERLNSGDLWIVDPLDGTKDFRSRTGDFSVMIAYIIPPNPVVAVIYAPVHDKLYYAIKGTGAYLIEKNGQRQELKVSNRTLEEAIITLSRKEFTPEQAEEIRQKFSMKGYLQAGSMGIKVGCIAEGRGDLYVNNDPRAGEWDACAPGLILTEAGGMITDYDGKEIEYNKEQPYLPRGAVCSNGASVHSAILRVVEQHIPLKKVA
jgi:3'(2'), 5'-bisphosphate nucleotidase